MSKYNLKQIYEKRIIDISNIEKIEQIILATDILKKNSNKEDNYMIYENKEEISIGIGMYLNAEIYNNRIILIIDGDEKKIEVKNLNEDINNLFKSLEIKEWKAYGITDFNYAKNTFLNNINNEDILIRFFIPKIDIRIKNNSIEIKAIQNIKNICLNIKKSVSNLKDDSYEYTIDSKNLQSIKSKDEEDYKEIVSKGIEEIKKGYYEKVILSRKIILNKRISIINSYLNGRKYNTPARSYCLKFGELEAVGFSPETVVEVDCNRNVYTFPLAGTRALTEDFLENRKLKKELLKDPKEIAEHAASVKLALEEMEKVCMEGSVSVIKFMDVLERGTVQHLASRLKGKLNNNFNEWHAFSALFPAVTASGIPKVQCIDAIDRLEKNARGLYSGGVFTYDQSGNLDVALVLRTAFQNNLETWVRVGAGIVKLSNPERELEETKEKVSSILDKLVYLDN